MADPVTVQLEGFKEMAERLKQLGPKVARNTLRRAVSAAAAQVRNQARENAPVDSGTLKRAIAIKREKDKQGGPFAATYSVFVRQAKNGSAGQKNVTAYGKFDAYYARWIEFGTSKMPAQPFLAPAFDSVKEEALKTIGEKIDEGIQKAAAELAGQ